MPTEFQIKLYDFIEGFISERKNSPSFADMIEAMHIGQRSKSLITRSLRALEKDNRLFLKKDGRRLTISLPQQHLQLLGRISAGVPIEAIPDYQTLDINALLHGDNRFVLQVKGDSMIEEGILDGDFIICRYAEEAHEGDIVVALIDYENATLKRISYKVPGMITLIPANSELKPRAYPSERIRIQGIYIGLVRVDG